MLVFSLVICLININKVYRGIGGMWSGATEWTESLEHVAGRHGTEANRYFNWRNRDVVEAEGLVAVLAIEVNVQVVIGVVVMALAQLVAHTFAFAFDGMYKMVRAKECQRSGYTRLVDGLYSLFQFHQRQWATSGCQGACNKNAVDSWLDTMTLKECGYFLFRFHSLAKIQTIYDIIATELQNVSSNFADKILK